MTADVSASPTTTNDRRYLTYLIVVAVAGWALASYDTNLLVLTLPDIQRDLGLSDGKIGLLGFIVFSAEFVIALFIGYGMDQKGRKWMWMFCLAMAALFTGLTFFVQNYWQLALVRSLASGFAQAELAVSITLVNEQMPAKRRGLLYSVVQGGYPLGVFLASGVYLLVAASHGWRTVFLWGVVPLAVVAIGRSKIRESERFVHLKAMREAVAAHDTRRIAQLEEQFPVDVEDLERGSIRSLFATPGPVRNTLVRLSVVWLLYASAFVAVNTYITVWLTSEKGWSETQVATLLLVSGGIGYLFYLLGGLLGERFGRRNVLLVTGLLVGPLNLLLLLTTNHTAIAVLYFLAFQATNGTWSGAGYSYQAESFPTRVRGLAIGWMSSMFVGGLMIGSLLWTILVSSTNFTVAWVVIGVVLGFAQGVSTLLLPNIKPGQELEAIAR
ncbi:MFS transporter [uncultured Friedmanniella sp.]|uniref:MFS transporter n=1 Tax=uncultured Friedmanniella sp. TaxID=335381 RepID=UPI0035CC9E2B